MSLYECDLCDWKNREWRYGFAAAGAAYHYHMDKRHPEDDVAQTSDAKPNKDAS